MLKFYPPTGLDRSATNSFRPDASWVSRLTCLVVFLLLSLSSPLLAQYNSNAVTVAGTGTAGSAANQLDSPFGIYVDEAGSMYVADYNNHRVQKWASGATSGTTVAGTGTAGSAANQLNHPLGVYVDGAGAIYVSDTDNNRVQKWASGATSGTTVAGTGTAGSAANQLNYPIGIYVDGAGATYVADASNSRIQKWAAGATSGTTVAGGNGQGSAANQLWSAAGVYIDGAGAIYVADGGNNRIQKWASGATSGTTVAGTGVYGPASNQLSYPFAVYVDGAGTMYVSDQQSHRIQKWTAGATSGTTVAGGYGNDALVPYQLNYPRGIYLDRAGAIYVADQRNNRIQKFSRINPLVNPSLTIATTSQTSCTGASVSFTATSTNGGTSPAYQWKKNGSNVGTSDATYTDAALTSGDVINCVLTSNDQWASPTTATSNSLTMTVNPLLTPALTLAITTGSQTSYAGTAITFTATPINGGTNPRYQWRKNGTNVGTNSATYTDFALANNDLISCILVSNVTCYTTPTADSNSLKMTVIALVTPTLTIATGSQTNCAGKSVSFTATPTNGGSSPAYQWKKNGSNVGTNSATYTDAALANNDVISCVLTSNAPGTTTSTATSNSLTMTVNPLLTPALTLAITTGSQTSYAGTAITFTAMPTNGGTNPAYQWKKNGSNVGTNTATYTDFALANNDVISCVLTSNVTCPTTPTATSNDLTMTVIALVTPTLTIATTSSQTSCAGTSVSFTATPTNGGSSPAYQWKKNGSNVGTNTATYTDAALANSDVISCVLTSNAPGTTTSTATSNSLTMTVNARPDAPALTPASSSLAATLTPLSLTSFALATTGNSLHFFQAGGSELSPPTVSIATAGVMSFSVGQTNNASGCKSLLTPLSLTITATPTSQTVCRSSNATLNVTLVGTAFQWYKNGTTTANKLTELTSAQRGTTTATLTLVNLQTTADYYCKITTSTGVQTVGPLKVSVNFGCSARPAAEEADLQLLVLVRPNPIVDGHLRALVKGAQGQALNVALYSLQGELVNQQVWPSAPAEVNLDWDISQRTTGVLLLRAQTPTQQQTIKIIQN
ncbi:hypothetical protein [Spirosoma linguale]